MIFRIQFSSFGDGAFDESKDVELRALLLDAMLIADNHALHFYVLLALMITRRSALLAARHALVEAVASSNSQSIAKLLNATLAVHTRNELATLLRSAAGVR